MKIEVLGTERRRRWSFDDKVRIVEEAMQPTVTVTEVARRHGLAPSIVFTWRRLAGSVAALKLAASELRGEGIVRGTGGEAE